MADHGYVTTALPKDHFRIWVPDTRRYASKSMVAENGVPQRHIAGLMSLDNEDHEEERILQEGLDHTYFLKRGVFNDNHSDKTPDILGWPSMVQMYKKGEQLPDATLAPYNCTWVEGILSNRPNADAVWELSQDMEAAGRCLGMSIEGKIEARQGPKGRIIAKAKILNCAITANPVNDETRLHRLVRSMRAIQELRNEQLADVEKALTVGYPVDGTGGPLAPGTNAANTREDLDGVIVTPDGEVRRRRRRRLKTAKKSLNRIDLLQSIYKAHPGASVETAMAMVALTELHLRWDVR